MTCVCSKVKGLSEHFCRQMANMWHVKLLVMTLAFVTCTAERKSHSGWCVNANLDDVNSDTISATASTKDGCLAACLKNQNAKGCEWSGRKCVVHTNQVCTGSGTTSAYSCWVFTNCAGGMWQMAGAEGSCGLVSQDILTNSRLSKRVIGGEAAIPNRWPWQVLVQVKGRKCGGTIISMEWVVTAAHCVMSFKAKEFIVRTGEHDLAVIEGTEDNYRVEKVIKHPQFNKPYMLNNDIALLKLSRRIKFNKYRSPVCLPPQAAKVGEKCMITGWGKTSHLGKGAQILQEVELPVVSREECHKLHIKNFNLHVTEAMVCAGSGGSSNKHGCHGDSGGPFVCKLKDRWVLQGVVSHGSPTCDSSKAHTVFANVFYFTSWIKETTSKG